MRRAVRALRPTADAGAAEALVDRSGRAQRRWGAVPLRERLGVLRRARHGLAARAAGIAASVRRRPVGETLTSEVLPLLESVAFLETDAGRILDGRRHGGFRSPMWLRGVDVDIEREPFGVVLVVAPSNYPLMLPGIQSVQALAAGNSVIVKPAPGGKAVMDALADVLGMAGLPADAFIVSGESADEAEELCRAGVDKILFTGSAQTGRAVLAATFPALTPVTLELSGNDAAFVRRDADVEAAAAALAFGMSLNGGATCVAPRRVFVARELAPALERRLVSALAGRSAVRLDGAAAALAADVIDEAVTQGARVLCGGIGIDADSAAPILEPVVLASVTPGMRISRTELFAPLLALTAVRDDGEALACAAASPYALGATVFGRDVDAAEAFARRIDAGVVVVNDAIVPTADPRAPLAPRRSSGVGVTRGAEGLLALTRPKAILVARGRKPHLRGPSPPAELTCAYIGAAYGGGGVRLEAIARLLRQVLRNGIRGKGRPA